MEVEGRKRACMIILGLLAIWCIYYVIVNGGKNSAYRTISIQANFAGYANFTEMEAAATIILIGTPTQDFTDRKPVTSRYPGGDVQDFYTLTDIQIERIIKNESTLNLEQDLTMQVIEPVVLTVDGNGDKIKLTLNGYVEMQTDTSYLLFLIESSPGIYSGMNFENSRFAVTKAGKKVKGASSNSTDLYTKFRGEAFEKYGLN